MFSGKLQPAEQVMFPHGQNETCMRWTEGILISFNLPSNSTEFVIITSIFQLKKW